MSKIQQDDGSEDVADFLKRIRELGDRTKREDEHRSRKLEEEILQGRKEREARRAERARSISPTKDSPSTTPSRQATHSTTKSSPGTPKHTFRLSQSENTANMDSRKSVNVSSPDRALPKTLSLNLDLEPSKPSPPPTGTLSRTGTLSWQQRPSSRGGGSRPNSLLSLDNKIALSPRASPAPEPISKEPSRTDVARSLEEKDPSWFKQTADRGIGSAAYRRSQENGPMVENSIQLPGMKGHLGAPAIDASRTKALQDSTRDQASNETRNSLSMPLPTSTRSSLLSENSPRFEPPAQMSRESSPSRNLAMSPAQRSISPERPVSPTKGLGGFVQSAMLKRSDSLNKHKRGGSQASLSLNRGDSAASNRKDRHLEDSTATTRATISEFQDNNVQKIEGGSAESRSRAMDSKRWSPTKQSWLEGAISKNDPPRPKSGSLQSPPMWLSDLQKSKDSNIKPNTEKSFAHQPIEVGGLLRTSQDLSKPKSSLLMTASARGNETRTATHVSGHTVEEKKTETGSSGSGINSRRADTQDEAPVLGPRATETELKLPEAMSTAQPNSSKPPPITSPKPDVSKRVPESRQDIKVVSKTWGTKSTTPSSLESKAKTEPLPRKDFRAGLRSVNNSADKSKNEELEFKNVFGKLKKAETKNYTAPDELKDNILRGKTGLNTTSGPRVYEKKDEFKDSILKKKEEMKTSPSAKAKSPEPDSLAKPTIPEAIARRQNLVHAPTTKVVSEQEKPIVVPKPLFSRTKSAVESDKLYGDVISKSTTNPEPSTETTGGRPLQSPAAIKQSSVQTSSHKPGAPEKKTSAPAQLQSSVGSSKFADRFNPGLAGLLARGPISTSNEIAPPPRTTSPVDIRDENKKRSNTTTMSNAQLSHAIKGRAKGPKRRAPAKVALQPNEESRKPEQDNSNPVQSSMNVTSIAKPLSAGVRSAIESQNENSDEGLKAASSLPDESFRKQRPSVASKPVVSTLPASELNMPQQISSIPSNSGRTKFVSLNSQSLESNKIIPMAGIQKPPVAPKSPILSPKSPKSPPLPGSKAKALSRISSNGQASDRLQVPIPGGTLDAFFDNLSLPKINTDIDTQALLLNYRTSEAKIRTLRKDVWEITGDGKKSSLPQHQEYILFENRMYFCRHHYETANGKQLVDAYLWCGDGVSSAATEDAQVFCRSEAREAGCKLQTLLQGKETLSFFEALGGIVITRRRDSVTYMLCGRRHLGQVVFDEVDLSSESLCSGFTFIIATTGGDLYLWKGQGANADEIGCARLIGMDLGLTGEIEEVEEGCEPVELLKALKSSKIQSPQMFWTHKASTDKYNTRLFCVDADTRPRSNSSLSNFAVNMWRRRPSSPSIHEVSDGTVKEISPYAQSDISEDQIFVLDAFFEIFVIAGSQSRSKFSSFALALNFAQEYGILSVSVQDRPFIPKGYVLFLGAAGEVPQGLRIAFRKWDDRIHRQQSSWAPENVTMPLHDALRALENCGSAG